MSYDQLCVSCINSKLNKISNKTVKSPCCAYRWLECADCPSKVCLLLHRVWSPLPGTVLDQIATSYRVIQGLQQMVDWFAGDWLVPYLEASLKLQRWWGGGSVKCIHGNYLVMFIHVIVCLHELIKYMFVKHIPRVVQGSQGQGQRSQGGHMEVPYPRNMQTWYVYCTLDK